jgi:hypothetical protein
MHRAFACYLALFIGVFITWGMTALESRLLKWR